MRAYQSTRVHYEAAIHRPPDHAFLSVSVDYVLDLIYFYLALGLGASKSHHLTSILNSPSNLHTTDENNRV